MMSKIGFNWSFVRLIVSIRYVLEMSGSRARRIIGDKVPPSIPSVFPSQSSTSTEAGWIAAIAPARLESSLQRI